MLIIKSMVKNDNLTLKMLMGSVDCARIFLSLRMSRGIGLSTYTLCFISLIFLTFPNSFRLFWSDFSHWLWVIQMVSKVHNYPTLSQRSCSIKEPCAIRVHPTWVPTRLPVDPAVPEIENDLGTKEAAGDVGDVGVDGCVLSAQAAYWIPQKLRSIRTQTL